jgi:uncharacterized hydantoinase/oxoprolinase family protein
LKTGELLWSGLYFVPIPSISNVIALDGETFQVYPLTRSMIFDAYLILGIISQEDVLSKFNYISDKGLLSFDSCVDRILDTICADRELLTVNDAKKIAQFLIEKQRKNIEKTVKRILEATQQKYNVNLKTVAIAGAGKDIILQKILKNMDFEGIIDIEKVASEILDMTGSYSNCETSLGCTLIGLQNFRDKAI